MYVTHDKDNMYRYKKDRKPLNPFRVDYTKSYGDDHLSGDMVYLAYSVEKIPVYERDRVNGLLVRLVKNGEVEGIRSNYLTNGIDFKLMLRNQYLGSIECLREEDDIESGYSVVFLNVYYYDKVYYRQECDDEESLRKKEKRRSLLTLTIIQLLKTYHDKLNIPIQVYECTTQLKRKVIFTMLVDNRVLEEWKSWIKDNLERMGIVEGLMSGVVLEWCKDSGRVNTLINRYHGILKRRKKKKDLSLFQYY